MTYTIEDYRRRGGGYAARIPEIPGAVAFGRTIRGARAVLAWMVAGQADVRPYPGGFEAQAAGLYNWGATPGEARSKLGQILAALIAP